MGVEKIFFTSIIFKIFLGVARILSTPIGPIEIHILRVKRRRLIITFLKYKKLGSRCGSRKNRFDSHDFENISESGKNIIYSHRPNRDSHSPSKKEETEHDLSKIKS